MKRIKKSRIKAGSRREGWKPYANKSNPGGGGPITQERLGGEGAGVVRVRKIRKLFRSETGARNHGAKT